jgi:hypothetical protein
MEPIRPPFYVGMVMLAAGLLVLVVWWFIGEPTTVNMRFLHGLLFGLAALLVTVGGFLFVSIGMVFAIYLMLQPRAKKTE